MQYQIEQNFIIPLMTCIRDYFTLYILSNYLSNSSSGLLYFNIFLGFAFILSAYSWILLSLYLLISLPLGINILNKALCLSFVPLSYAELVYMFKASFMGFFILLFIFWCFYVTIFLTHLVFSFNICLRTIF